MKLLRTLSQRQPSQVVEHSCLTEDLVMRAAGPLLDSRAEELVRRVRDMKGRNPHLRRRFRTLAAAQANQSAACFISHMSVCGDSFPARPGNYAFRSHIRLKDAVLCGFCLLRGRAWRRHIRLEADGQRSHSSVQHFRGPEIFPEAFPSWPRSKLKDVEDSS